MTEMDIQTRKYQFIEGFIRLDILRLNRFALQKMFSLSYALRQGA